MKALCLKIGTKKKIILQTRLRKSRRARERILKMFRKSSECF